MDCTYIERSASSLTTGEWEELSELTREAFSEHKKRGLRMLPCDADAGKLSQFLADCELILISDSGRTVAYLAYIIHQAGGMKFLEYRLAATSIHHKKHGLGKQLFKIQLNRAEEAGCLYMQTDTSCKAAGARAYHHACGFEDWYYTHWRNTNYYSIVLRKELPEGRRMSRKLRYKSLIRSYLSVHFRYRENGQERRFYKWIKWLFRNKS